MSKSVLSNRKIPANGDLLQEIRVLVDDGSNIEYTRGVLEIVSSFIVIPGIDHADRALALGREVGLSEEVLRGLY